MQPRMDYNEDNRRGITVCFISQPLPTPDIWVDAYAKDADTAFIMKLLELDIEFGEK